jgi:hypothetical protein
MTRFCYKLDQVIKVERLGRQNILSLFFFRGKQSLKCLNSLLGVGYTILSDGHVIHLTLKRENRA